MTGRLETSLTSLGYPMNSFKGFLGGIVHYFAGHPIQTYLDYPLRLLAWMWLNNADRHDDEPIELFQVDNDTYILDLQTDSPLGCPPSHGG